MLSLIVDLAAQAVRDKLRTFPDPADYDKLREDDRVSLVGLNEIVPGKPVHCIIKHADGTSETLELKHSYGDSQFEWFRVGSALNLFHQ